MPCNQLHLFRLKQHNYYEDGKLGDEMRQKKTEAKLAAEPEKQKDDVEEQNRINFLVFKVLTWPPLICKWKSIGKL